MKQPTEHLFLGKEIPQNGKSADNDLATTPQRSRYRITLDFEKTPGGAAEAMEHLNEIGRRIKGVVFVIILGERHGDNITLKKIMTKEELLKLISPPQKQSGKVSAKA